MPTFFFLLSSVADQPRMYLPAQGSSMYSKARGAP